MGTKRCTATARMALAAALVLLVALPVQAIVMLGPEPEQAYLDFANSPQFDPVGFIESFASGTLIAPNWVLTAGHVTNDLLANPVGNFIIGGNSFAIDHAFTSPNFVNLSNGSDIGLLHLATPVAGISPALLNDTTNVTVGQLVTLVGFGVTSSSGAGDTGVKRAANARIYQLDPPLNPHVLYTQPSADPLTGATAPGDSGGPAFIHVGSEYSVLGVNSFGYNDPDNVKSGESALAVAREFIDSHVPASVWTSGHPIGNPNPGHVQYAVTDLGTMGGFASFATGLSANGQVTGVFYPDSSFGHAFLYDGTTMHDLGTLGGTNSGGAGINASGKVTGWSETTSVDTNGGSIRHAFLYDGTTMHDLGTLGGASNTSEGTGINDNGQVTGFASALKPSGIGSTTHAFLYDGTLHDLGTLGGIGTKRSFGYGINASGQVAGQVDAVPFSGPGAGTRVFLWTPTTSNGPSGAMLNIGPLNVPPPGTLYLAEGLGINDSGQVTGWTTSFDNGEHAFLYDGTFHDLGTLGGTGFSHGNGINASGQVTGYADTGLKDSNGNIISHAFLYGSGSGMVDLNSLVDSLSGWELLYGSAVNDAWQITGTGLFNGEIHAFLLSPTSIVVNVEPGSSVATFPGVTTLAGDVIVTHNPNVTQVSAPQLGFVGGSLDIIDNGSATEVNLGSLRLVHGDLNVSDNGPNTMVNLGPTIFVDGSFTFETHGEDAVDLSGASVGGSTSIEAEGATMVMGQTAQHSTDVTLVDGPASMKVSLPKGTFTAPAHFTIQQLSGAALAPQPGTMDGQNVMADPVAAYEFAFDIASLGDQANLTFDINLSELPAADQTTILTALAGHMLTLAVKANSLGSVYQLFAIAAAGQDPTLDMSVRLLLLDALGQQLPDGSMDVPTILRFEGIVGHFSTYALVTATSVPVPGDYNHNGIVDAADYTVWRDSFGRIGTGLAADGDGNGSIDAGDYDMWQTNFGHTAGSGSFANGSVPEPASVRLFLLGGVMFVWVQRLVRRSHVSVD